MSPPDEEICFCSLLCTEHLHNINITYCFSLIWRNFRWPGVQTQQDKRQLYQANNTHAGKVHRSCFKFPISVFNCLNSAQNIVCSVLTRSPLFPRWGCCWSHSGVLCRKKLFIVCRLRRLLEGFDSNCSSLVLAFGRKLCWLWNIQQFQCELKLPRLDQQWAVFLWI